MKRNQPGLPKLGAADSENAARQVNVLNLKANGLTDSQTRYGEQAKEAGVPPARPFALGPCPRRLHKTSDVFIAVQIRARANVPCREKAGRQNFRLRIKCRDIPGKSADSLEAVCWSTSSGGLIGPLGCQPSRDAACLVILHERNELWKPRFFDRHFEAQAAPHCNVVFQHLSQGFHFLIPPGHGCASGRSAGRSTFA
jgi:hypothetical protein